MHEIAELTLAVVKMLLETGQPLEVGAAGQCRSAVAGDSTWALSKVATFGLPFGSDRLLLPEVAPAAPMTQLEPRERR